jgi:hypothetical protein
MVDLTDIIDGHLKFLDESWRLVIFGSEENKDRLQNYYPNCSFISLGGSTLTAESYNNLLTTKEFWERIPAENILIFQTDSMLLRSGFYYYFINDILIYDFIGAPIYHIEFPAMNGGLSLRRKSAMLKVIDYKRYDAIHNEDLYFCNAIQELKGTLPTKITATHFSVETIYSMGSLGFHAIEKYLTPEQCNLIKNQYSRPISPI